MANVSVVIRASEDNLELTASNPTVTAFFKAYSQVSPKLKKAKDPELLHMIEEATSLLNKVSNALGKKGGGKKGSKKKGFANVKVPTKKERIDAINEE